MQKFLLTLSIGVLLVSGCSHPQKKVDSTTPQKVEETVTHEGHFDIVPFVGDFKIKRTVLPNGLTLIIVNDDSSPTFAYQTWFRVGSRNEVIGKTGLAHFFEHLMFKGTKNHPEGEFDSLLERAGVEGENAFTANDHTAYVQELPKEHLDLIIGLESDRMTNLLVNDDSFKTEREVVQNERRLRKENSPDGIIYETLFETAFTENPYHWPVIGYEQDLNLMNSQDARNFYEQYYSPDRATIVVVGDVDEDVVLRKIEKAYGNIPAKNTPDLPMIVEPEQTAQRRKKLELNIQVQKIWMGYKIPGIDSPDSPVFEVLESLLTDGLNSRLNRALVDSGIAASTNSGSFSLRDPGIFLVSADLQKGKTALLAEPIILREIERLKNNLVGDEELKRAKNLLRFHFLENLSTTTGQAHFIGEMETSFGNVQRGIQMQNAIQTVTPEQLQDVVKKYFDTKKLTVIVGVPKKESPKNDPVH